MGEQLTIFDLMNEEDKSKFAPKDSNEWKWTFKDYPKEKNGLKVFSCFACGGGSTMGYKLAGCDVIGDVEIDPKMNELYVKNHNPKYNYLMDLREFNKLPDAELPPELFDLDILDGSPPCTTFSSVGLREKTWGKKKKFREGQKEQTLDDLSFIFIETVKKLNPKVVIMENVEGLLLGEAWGYVQQIYKDFNNAGYDVKHYLLKGEYMGVPQTRHRVFFIAIKKELNYRIDSIDLNFNYRPILYKEIKAGAGIPINGELTKKTLLNAIETDKSIGEIHERLGEKKRDFSTKLCWDNCVLWTITASSRHIRPKEFMTISIIDIIHAQTFPEDYDFINNSFSNVGYICGMSVPPLMIKRIVSRLIDQGVFNYKEVKNDI